MKQYILVRVNAACNFWADTKDIDYISFMSKEEILEQDTDNMGIAYLVKELWACGY